MFIKRSLTELLKLILILSFISCICNASTTIGCSTKETPTSTYSSEIQREHDFNFGWKFHLGDVQEAKEHKYNDKKWRTIRLPHDWSVEHSFDKTLEGATAYLPGGIGWYRKTFDVEIKEDQIVYLLFDGIYNNAEIWINGHNLGFHPYGYTPFYFDLTDYMTKSGKKNTISVRVDRSRYVDSRWYPGSGINRNVKLITTNKVNTPIWGTFVKTPKITDHMATISIEHQVENKNANKQAVHIKHQVFDPSQKLVGQKTYDVTLKPGATKLTDTKIKVSSPQKWNLNEPALYQLKTSVYNTNGDVLDQYTTSFGIRSIRFEAKTGFYLNDVKTKIKGVCLHQDAGLVGTAVPEGVWERRLKTLKESGCNAIRISHHPASDELLDLCDKLGLLVQDEFFDEWDYPKDKRLNMYERHDDYISRGYTEHFQEWAHKDLKSALVAHRNHPSIIQWSIGNEIEWTYPRNRKATGFFENMNWDGNYFWSQPPFSPERIKKEYNAQEKLEYQIEKTAHKLSKWTKELDQTRPVIANCILPSVSFETGYTDALDIVGFSYRRVMYDYARKNYPDKIVMGTENVVQWHEWKAVEERDFIAGTFFWTGIDYMGEVNDQWPVKTLSSGMLDTAGFKKPSFHMIKSLWKDEPHVFLCTQKASESVYKKTHDGSIVEKEEGAWEKRLWFWYDVNTHWNYDTNESVIAEVYTNCPEVELFLNDKSLGVKKLDDFEDHIIKWEVPFQKGKLEARAYHANKSKTTCLQTSDKPESAKITSDKNELKSNAYDVAHIEIQLFDEHDTPVFSLDKEITFDVKGPCTILGVDNGNKSSTQDFQSDKITTHNGRALMIIRSTHEEGDITIQATSGSLKSNIIKIEAKRVE